jgi:hypothetical protein
MYAEPFYPFHLSRMSKYLATSLALASVALLAGCTGSVSENNPDTDNGAYLEGDADSSLEGAMGNGGVASLAEELREEGMTVNVATAQNSSTPIFPSATAYTLSVNGQDIQAYEYADEDAAEQDEADISPDGSTVGGSSIAWVGSPHFYRMDNVILVYLGNNPAIIEALEDVAGPPFAGQGAATSSAS